MRLIISRDTMRLSGSFFLAMVIYAFLWLLTNYGIHVLRILWFSLLIVLWLIWYISFTQYSDSDPLSTYSLSTSSGSFNPKKTPRKWDERLSCCQHHMIQFNSIGQWRYPNCWNCCESFSVSGLRTSRQTIPFWFLNLLCSLSIQFQNQTPNGVVGFSTSFALYSPRL